MIFDHMELNYKFIAYISMKVSAYKKLKKSPHTSNNAIIKNIILNKVHIIDKKFL